MNYPLVFIAYGQTAQRFALPACGRAGIRFGSRKNSKPENYLKKAANPTRRVHALLGGVELAKLFCSTAIKFHLHQDC